jgi:hypothetical protein
MIAGTPVFELEVAKFELEQDSFETRGRLRHGGFKPIEISVEYSAQSLAGCTLSVAERRQRRWTPMQQMQEIASQELCLGSLARSVFEE